MRSFPQAYAWGYRLLPAARALRRVSAGMDARIQPVFRHDLETGAALCGG